MSALNYNRLKHQAWRPARLLFALSIILTLCAAIAIATLYKYINEELSYVSSTLYLQKNYGDVFAKLLKLQSDQQYFVKSKDSQTYQSFNQTYNELSAILQNISAISFYAPQLRPCISEFVRAISTQATAVKENMDIAQKLQFNNPVDFSNYDLNFSRIINAFVQKENAVLDKHQETINHIKNLFIISMLIFMLGLAISSIIAIQHFYKDIKQLNAKQKRLNDENLELESNIRQRTSELESARLHAEKERQRVELLLQDTSHRIGNSLATVASLLGMQANRSKNEEVSNALISARDRIQTIAAAHRRLRLGSDMETTKVNEFLQAVIHDIEFSMPADVKERVHIVTQLHQCWFSSRDATTLGIVMGELLTNAIKHAFPVPKTGEINVFLGKKHDKLCLIIEDNGIGVKTNKSTTSAEEKMHPGLGQLVAKQLCMQFNCEPVYEELPNSGTKVTIDLSKVESKEEG
ncbi:histidine kinase dimerization/phosphoacceptor domain -containing protein [Bartonella sp. TP]|uniref:sensor histidine kinase n=1 Tax=Bartonella sp. TP TaxID=3057550 RepID=UPI0025B04820|nr:histidine kinase dimerization/phosphoacceptor domain -containing protein [Bartonella sp. TP]WJW79607.1 histidine kinase dimerization/phosphoacceptor domain -containing protein [Bartonella sp. TP]